MNQGMINAQPAMFNNNMNIGLGMNIFGNNNQMNGMFNNQNGINMNNQMNWMNQMNGTGMINSMGNLNNNNFQLNQMNNNNFGFGKSNSFDNINMKNQMNQFNVNNNQINGFDMNNQMNMINFIMNNNMNFMNLMNQMNQMNQMTQVNQMNQMNGMNGLNMVNMGMNVQVPNNQNYMDFMKNNFPNNQNNFTNNQNNFTNNQNNGNNTHEMKSILPREIKNERMNFFPDENMKNIKFDASTGIKVIVTVSKYATIEQAIKEFVKKLGLGENVIDNDLIFLLNGGKMDAHSQDPVITLPDLASITVFDQNNVIGAS